MRDFEAIGAARHDAVLSPAEVDRVALLFADDGKPGERLGADRLADVVDLIGTLGPVGGIARKLFGKPAFAVRALLLDKSARGNWALGWHQDRTIAVAERVEAAGYGPWSVKRGQLHVQPPQSVIEAMVTLRIHVDRVDADNAPLRVIEGSHRLGRLSDAKVLEEVARLPHLTNLAEPGDVWAYRTPIIHASAATSVERRRVLQIDYACEPPPGRLEWAMAIR